MKAEQLQFKELVATCLAEKGEEFNNKFRMVGHKVERKNSEYADENGMVYVYGSSTTACVPDEEYGSGDFRSEECTKIRDRADFIITNPPFSLFREFIKWCVESGKQFLILGSINEINFEEVFNGFKNGLVWRGVTIHNGHTKFVASNEYSTPGERSKIGTDGRKMVEVGVRWYTNMDNRVRHEDLLLCKRYFGHEIDYPFYAGTSVIHVGKTSDIPLDFEGVMGVPVTFLDKWNPDQFELLGWASPSRYFGDIQCLTIIGGVDKYARLLIKQLYSEGF